MILESPPPATNAETRELNDKFLQALEESRWKLTSCQGLRQAYSLANLQSASGLVDQEPDQRAERILDQKARSRSGVFEVFGPLRDPYDALSGTLNEIAELAREEEFDQCGRLRPTQYAMEIAISLLLDAFNSLKRRFLQAWVTTDFEGGIRLEWETAHRKLKLLVPASSEKSVGIYYQDHDHYDLEQGVSASTLVAWLSWLVDHDR